MLDETLKNLKSAPNAEANLSGVPSYDILANPEYQSAF